MPIFIVLLIAGSAAYVLIRYLYYKSPELFICLALLINFDFFYLLPPIGGFYNYGITLLPITAILLIEQLLRGNIRLDLFGALIFIYTALLLIGIIAAFHNGQSIVLSVKAVKYQFLIYFYFIVASHKIKLEKFGHYFIFFSIIFVLFVNIDTLFFNGQLIFSRASEQFIDERLDRIRFSMGASMISIACVMAFASFLKTKAKLSGCLFSVLFLHIFFVIQTRMIIAGIIVTCALLLITVRNFSFSGIFAMVFLICISIPIVMLSGNFFAEIGLVKKTRTDIQTKTGSWQGRINSYKHYWGRIAESPFFGYGYENLNWDKSPEPRLRARGIFKEDIGISHFFYENGFLGILWFIILTIAVVKRIWPIKKTLPEITAYFILSYTVIITLDYFFYIHNIIFLGIFLGLLARYSNLQKLNPNLQTG
jgi:O-antigen ligase